MPAQGPWIAWGRTKAEVERLDLTWFAVLWPSQQYVKVMLTNYVASWD